MPPRTVTLDQPCPCGSGQAFGVCCQPVLAGDKPAPTAETLMRSRYTAFVVGDYGYVERTLAPEALADFSRAELETMAEGMQWLGLSIRQTEKGRPDDTEGTVEFAARFKRNGEEGRHHERGQFRKTDGQWLYVDGAMNPKGQPVQVTKIGRNDPCPCGSGKKYKKCCAA